MRKHLLIALLSLLAVRGIAAQSTTVTLNVTDAGSQAWISGTYRITFLPAPQFPNANYSWTGGAFDPTTVYSGNLNGAGSATISLPSNNAISPTGTNWTFRVCPLATSPCYEQAYNVIGVTLTVAPVPPAISINANASAMAYADAQVKASKGGTYFNVSTLLGRLCTAATGTTCTSWSNTGAAVTASAPVVVTGSNITCPTCEITTAKNAASGYAGLDGSSLISTSQIPTSIGRTIASGTAALGTSAISASTCATVVTVSATGVATTDSIETNFNADPTATTGYIPGAMLTIVKYPTTNNVNFKVCNNTGASITPSAVTLNWRVAR